MKYKNGHIPELFDVVTNGSQDAVVVEINMNLVVISRESSIEPDLAVKANLLQLKERLNGDSFEYVNENHGDFFVQDGERKAYLPEGGHGYWE